MSLKAAVSKPEQIQDHDLQAGDILVFKLPVYKPSLAERFIKFVQHGRSDSRPYADAVHAAVVTEVSPFGEVNMAHFVSGGYQEVS